VILSAGCIVRQGTPHDLTAAAWPGGGGVVTFGAPPALDVVALAAAVGPRTTVSETAAGRYRVEAAEVDTPAVTAAVANFLAAQGATLTDLATGHSLEDVYFEAVGTSAEAGPDEAPTAGAGTARGGRRRRQAR
jgi:hypothetical protein